MRRTTLITAALAASVLTGGFAASAAAAQSDGGVVASPTTVPIDLGSLGITPEQMDCVIANAGELNLDDMTVIMEVLTQCGINPLDIATPPTDPVIGASTTLAQVQPGAVDPVVVASLMVVLGVDPATAQCIEDGLLAATVPGDDNEALAMLQSCGLTLNDLLTGVLAVNDLADGAGPATPTLPAVPTTVAGIAVDSPIVQQLIDLVRDQYGIELTPEQASCLVDNIGALDPEDMAATLAVMEQCGISLTELSG